MQKLWLIRFIVFLSAFLLFQIEMIMGKVLLPSFGGGYMIWGACLVFFQAVLFLGYLYAHGAMRTLGSSRARLGHGILLILPLFFFPGKPLPLTYTLTGLPMVIDVFWQLSLTIGPVFLLLSSTSILWQAWISHSDLPEKDNPYTLFAVSNLGSFAGLWSYPFIFEWLCDLKMQQQIWRVLYVLVVLLQWIAWGWIRFLPQPKVPLDQKRSWGGSVILRCLLYGAGGVIIFMAVTNVITVEMAPIPLLWIIPLSLYLLAYVFNFMPRPWCPRWMIHGIHLFVGWGVLFFFIMFRQMLPVALEFLILLGLGFIYCMFCQQRIYALKPSTSHLLTMYYLAVAGGSSLGGLVAIWVIPPISTTHLEFFLGLFCLNWAWRMEEEKRAFSLGPLLCFLAFMILLLYAPRLFVLNTFVGLFISLGLMTLILIPIGRHRQALWVSLIVVGLGSSWIIPLWEKEKYIFYHRNYYGIMKIFEKGSVRFLMHGTTMHGAQFTDPERAPIPLAYYNPRSPVAEILIHDAEIKKIGMIGLGVGALSAYLKVYQHLDIFELDPDVLTIASTYFTHLDRVQGTIQTYMGDARISLEKLKSQNYDLLIIDAFNGDNVPVHLLTQEALTLYRRHLKAEGLILFNFSNRYIDLLTPLSTTALTTGAFVGHKKDVDFISELFTTNWAVITWNQETRQKLMTTFLWNPLKPPQDPGARGWRDPYTPLLPYFNFPDLLKSLIHFQRR